MAQSRSSSLFQNSEVYLHVEEVTSQQYSPYTQTPALLHAQYVMWSTIFISNTILKMNKNFISFRNQIKMKLPHHRQLSAYLQTPLVPSTLHCLYCWSCRSEYRRLCQSHISSAQYHGPQGADWKHHNGQGLQTHYRYAIDRLTRA